MPESIETYKIVASLIGGGAVGAIITALVGTYRNRIQPVGKRIEILPLLTSSFSGSALKPEVTVSDGSTSFKFGNLYVADVQIVNRGNKDHSQFTFGITLADGDTAVHVEPYGLDRHHAASLPNPPSPGKPTSELDITLKPFNRGNSYTLRVFVVAGSAQPGAISIGSSEAIRFTDMPTLSEAVAQAASGITLNFFGLQIRFPR
jgi:hypothetical protein